MILFLDAFMNGISKQFLDLAYNLLSAILSYGAQTSSTSQKLIMTSGPNWKSKLIQTCEQFG